ncbi:response regulator [Desulfovibrio ferrophilus]|uniref:Multi-sensor Hybrid Histidine Kinase n=1 Tax=Desulfovibrio ferrophilus TaxID=241368 RepID=A0A2Z6AVL4_9BACT|nr:response regulator [Desulfovibrio ferrophilus]BBD07258.1 multi-sensor Hybrid Histidine Kinase [Desulfovibrio ferrophilus]
MQVLLVEDEIVTRESARITLESLGYGVTAVGDGDEALKAFAQQDFDVVVMDIKMPVMDGLEATRRIRSSQGGQSAVPIIALTGFSPRELPNIQDAGINAFIEKPFEFNNLIKTIRSFAA